MADKELAQRMFDALVDYKSRTGLNVTQSEIGEQVAKKLKRDAFPSATVSRYFTGKREMDLATLAAFAEVLGVDPGWLGFGPRSKAPAPDGVARRLATPVSRPKKGKRA